MNFLCIDNKPTVGQSHYGHAIVAEFKIGPYLNVTELQISQELVNLIAI